MSCHGGVLGGALVSAVISRQEDPSANEFVIRDELDGHWTTKDDIAPRSLGEPMISILVIMSLGRP